MIINFEFNGIKYRNFDISDVKVRQQLEENGINLVPITKAEIQKQLLSFEKQRLQKILDEYAYNGLADIQLYANQNDTEAKALLDWYQTYDDLIWQYIDNDLAAFTIVDELLQIDIKNIEQQIFDQSIQTASLP